MNYREIKVFSLSRARYHLTARAYGTVLRGLSLEISNTWTSNDYKYFLGNIFAINDKNFSSLSFSELLRSEIMSKC